MGILDAVKNAVTGKPSEIVRPSHTDSSSSRGEGAHSVLIASLHTMLFRETCFAFKLLALRTCARRWYVSYLPCFPCLAVTVITRQTFCDFVYRHCACGVCTGDGGERKVESHEEECKRVFESKVLACVPGFSLCVCIALQVIM